MRVLVTNDDGITASGLAALAAAVVGLGHDVVAAAPLALLAFAWKSLGDDDGVEVSPVELEGAAGVPAYAVDAPPALAVMIARLGAFGESPKVVVSGINPGPNTGRSVLHSGTVGAALTAANFGLSGLAVSIGTGQPSHLETAASVAASALGWILRAPPRTVLNVNVPNLPLEQLRGVRAARLAPFGTVRAALGTHVDGRVQVELRDTEHELEPDTDTALVLAGYVTVTALLGVRAAADTDAPAAIEATLFSRAGG